MTKTLEKIASAIRCGFSLPRLEITRGAITPTHEEFVHKEYGESEQICESGGTVAASPDRYYGCRGYYSPLGRYLFVESLPLEAVNKFARYCSCGHGSLEFSHFTISKSAKPAAEKLQTLKIKLGGKMFYIPLSISLTKVAVPEGMKAWSAEGSEGRSVKSRYFLRRI